MVTKSKITQPPLDKYGDLGISKQEVSKYIPVAQELDKKLDDFVRFTSSPEEFKNKYGENLGEFNKSVILFSIILKNLEKVPEAERDEELKKLLSSMQEKMKVINENIEKIAPKLGYTVSYYPLDTLMGKDLKGIEDTLNRHFLGKQLELRDLFSEKALNILTDLFAFMVNKYPIGSVNASVPIISDTKDNEQKSAEGKFAQQVVLQQQMEQPVFKQPEEKQNKEYHSHMLKTGIGLTITGVVLGVLGVMAVVGSFAYLPMAALGLAGGGLAAVGFAIAYIGVFTSVAGLIDEAIHKHRVKKAQKEALEQEEKKKKEQKKKKEEEELELSREINNAKKDEKALKKQLTDQAWLEKFINKEWWWLEKYINAKTDDERKKRVEEAKKEIEKIMEEAKKRHISTALHDLLIEKAKDPNTPSWFLALLAQLRLSYHYIDLDMFKALAGNPNTPSELLVDFATRKRYFWARGVADVNDIREIAAKNQSTTPWVLEELLLKDKDNKIKAAAAANPSTPQDALSKAIFNKNFDISIKRIIAGNPSAPQEAIEYALKSKDENMAFAALGNPSILKYPDLLELASRNQENPRIKEEALKKLKELGLKG